MNQGTLALASDFVDYSDSSERPRARRNPARTAPTERAASPHERTTDSEKRTTRKNMDIPVMPHPGTDTQASPYQSRQTKEIT